MERPGGGAGGCLCLNCVQLAVAVLLVCLPFALAGSAALLALTVTVLLLFLAFLLALVLPALLALLATLLLLLAILPFAIHALLALWLLLVLLRTVLTFLVLTHGASPSPRLGQGTNGLWRPMFPDAGPGTANGWSGTTGMAQGVLQGPPAPAPPAPTAPMLPNRSWKNPVLRPRVGVLSRTMAMSTRSEEHTSELQSLMRIS